MDKDTLKDAKEDFKLCVDAESDQRKESLDDLEFARLGKQWPDEVIAQRKKEGRPCLTINRLPAFIKQVTNDARHNRPSIAVHPSSGGANKDTAEILVGLIRNIQNISRADIAYDTALDFAVTMGFGYWVIRDQYATEDSFDKDLVIERVSNPFSVYGDWESKEATSVDWNRAFITDLYSEKAFLKRWPGADVSGFQGADQDETEGLWYVEKRLQVAEYWTREKVETKLLQMTDGSVYLEDKYLEVIDGLSLKDMLDSQGVSVKGERPSLTYKVQQRIMSGAEILETNEWKGKYIPIVPVYGDEVNINGKRYFQSLVRFAKDPARMFNYWRTASTELVALAPKAPYIGAIGAFATDAGKWQQANNASLPYIEYDPVSGEPPPQRQPFNGVPAGALQEALNASDDMKNIMGLHDASLGAQSNETSGKAIMARQREGDVSTFNFVDNLTRSIEHTGTILIDLIPKHYDVARVIRCIKEDGSTYAVPVNQPVIPQQGQEQMPGQSPQQFQAAPEHIEGVTKVFNLTTGKYDVTVSSGPSYTTKRQESSEAMLEFIRVFPQSAPIIGDIVAKTQDWPGADEIAARLKAMLPPQANGGPPPMVQQLQQQLQQVGQQAQQMAQETQQLKQQLADKSAESNLKNRELDLKAGELKLKEREMLIKEGESQTRNHVERTNADVSRAQQIDIPQAQQQDLAQTNAATVMALQAIAERLQQKPTVKRATARKNPATGAYELESIEHPVEGLQ